MGFPATGIKGFGTVKLCGLNREPLPAIGTIIFICLVCLSSCHFFVQRYLINEVSTALNLIP
jgi:hypothetical protein